jgi:hypothetical protein
MTDSIVSIALAAAEEMKVLRTKKERAFGRRAFDASFEFDFRSQRRERRATRLDSNFNYPQQKQQSLKKFKRANERSEEEGFTAGEEFEDPRRRANVISIIDKLHSRDNFKKKRKFEQFEDEYCLGAFDDEDADTLSTA